MNYFFDTEFIEDGQTIELISIGIVAEDGRELYKQSLDFDPMKADKWVRENVFPALSYWELDNGRFVKIMPCNESELIWMSNAGIADEIIYFTDESPIFWAYYADYDWVALCQLYGRMVDLPKGWPMYCRDLRQWLDDKGLADVKQPDDAPHNALEDARWVRDTWMTTTQRLLSLSQTEE